MCLLFSALIIWLFLNPKFFKLSTWNFFLILGTKILSTFFLGKPLLKRYSFGRVSSNQCVKLTLEAPPDNKLKILFLYIFKIFGVPNFNAGLYEILVFILEWLLEFFLNIYWYEEIDNSLLGNIYDV